MAEASEVHRANRRDLIIVSDAKTVPSDDRVAGDPAGERVRSD